MESDMSPSRGASQGAGCRRADRCGSPCVTGVRSEAGLTTKGADPVVFSYSPVAKS